MANIPAARLVSSRSHIVPGKLRVSELFFEVPRDYSNLGLGNLRLFARSVDKHETPAAVPSEDEVIKKSQKPYMVYLQGGPGSGCRPPQDMGITKPILDRGYQMLYLDQRGTGLSSTITAATLALQGDARKQAEYLRLFRADNIVKDCEAVRKCLTGEFPPASRKWSLFGQSFGGFCAFTYLSKNPEGLREVFTSGGIPPIGLVAEEVYRATFKTVIQRNKAYYEKFPEDVQRVKHIVSHISLSKGIQLPSGGLLTVQRLLSIGIAFGGAGGIDKVHDIILQMWSELRSFSFFTRPTLSAFEGMTNYDEAVIYSVLHEAIYQEQGHASRWAADRIGKSLAEFTWLDTKSSTSDEEPLHFAGEMIFPFMFDTYSELKALKDVADILAEYTNWPSLYDEEQLARNEVPVYAATFIDDMYVDFNLVQQTVGKVKNCKQFITNTMYHSAIRSNTDDVLRGLFALRDDSID